jgi:alpha-tubulin suppressor-like RCC1 family protein
MTVRSRAGRRRIGIPLAGLLASSLVAACAVGASPAPHERVVAIAAAQSQTCAVMESGSARCWGADSTDFPKTVKVYRATLVEVGGVVRAIAGGNLFMCALTSDGGVRCWGHNDQGQLGTGTTTSSRTPVTVTNLANGVRAIDGGGATACALTNAGDVWCWGNNRFGQLGDGTTIDSAAPVKVLGLTGGNTSIAVGDNHACVLTASGGVRCWGLDTFGQAGSGTLTDTSPPVDVVGLASGVTAIDAGGNQSCALLVDGGVKCWGHNWQGNLGDGTKDDSSLPVDVKGLAGSVVAVAAGGAHTCALTGEGGVTCWGKGDSGSLGDGEMSTSTSPVAVSGLKTGVTGVTAGGSHACALMSDGTVRCWGYNAFGQLGSDAALDPNIPISPVPVSVLGL